MKKTWWFAVAVLSLAALPALAQSAGDASQKSRFYDMGAQQIDGTVRKPAALAVEAHVRPKWARLFALQKSLRPALQATAAEFALK